MLFNNPIFFAFLLLVAILLIPGSRERKKMVLLAASYLFYGYWNWKFCFLLLWSTLVDYYCALAIARIPASPSTNIKRKRLLWFSIVNNLLILGVFKYFNFFAQSAVHLLESLGMHASFATLHIVLPVGISFYTFQTMSYTIDVYREHIRPTSNFIDFANYVAFFPQLVAGPIERASRLLPQLERFSGFVKAGIRPGLTLMLTGYIKKVLISDSIAPIIDRTFNNMAQLDSLTLCCGLVLFSFQIYFDFSGYTDIARGVARLFGIRLMINFNQPYFSMNPAEFWRRWHISLSTWFRDYLYLPLSYTMIRSQKKKDTKKEQSLDKPPDKPPVPQSLPNSPDKYHVKTRYAITIAMTMFLCGLWHGATWSFVLWGCLHGLYLVIYRTFFSGARKKSRRLLRIIDVPGALKAFFMFLLVTITWLPFRAPDIPSAWTYLQRILSAGTPPAWSSLWPVIAILPLLLAMDIAAYRLDSHLYLLKLPVWLQNALLFSGYLAVGIVMILHINSVRPFIYFQF